MTKREMFSKVVEVMGTEYPEVAEMAKAELTAMDARNEKRRAEQTEKSKANAEIREKIYNYLTTLTEPISIKELYESEAFPELTKGKITALITKLYTDGRVTRETVKKVNYYKVITE